MIRGKTLSLRAIELEDSYLLQQLINEPHVSNNVVGWSKPVPLFSQKNWIESSNKSNNLRLIIVDNSTDEAIGVTGLWQVDMHNKSAESAIKILPKKSRKGFGTEAIVLTMAWAFYVVGMRRLYASILDFNNASLSLYIKKCGWRIEGREKEAIFKKGSWHDLYNVAILKSEFDLLADSQTYIDLVCPVDTTPNIDIEISKYL